MAIAPRGHITGSTCPMKTEYTGFCFCTDVRCSVRQLNINTHCFHPTFPSLFLPLQSKYTLDNRLAVWMKPLKWLDFMLAKCPEVIATISSGILTRPR